MKIILMMALFLRVESSLADADDAASLRESLKKVEPPTPEQVLSVGLVLSEQAQSIMEQKKKGDCGQREVVLEEKADQMTQDSPQCMICALLSEKNEKEYQLIVATVEKSRDIDKDTDKPKSKFDPEEIYLSYEGQNDQMFHGLFEPIHSVGDDFNGHTYGSKGSVTGIYKWGDLTLDLGTDLYVLAYRKYYKGSEYYEETDETQPRVLQEADEHSFARMGAKIYLNEKSNKEKEETSHSPYMRFGLGIEHDSDQGIGKAGGITQRESWHKMFNVKGNRYVNHMQDRTVVSGSAQLGLESYKPIGKMGLCSLVESGVSASSNGTVSLEAKVRASIDSGTFAGFSRKAPLFVLNVEAGIHQPLKVGNNPTLETDPEYEGVLENQNLRMIGDLKTSFTSVGAEVGGKAFRLSIDAIYEKNQWNDGDIIYRTTAKWKY